jgi:hypothetical protein
MEHPVRSRLLTGAVGVVAAGALAAGAPAQAAPLQSGDYGKYAHEGKYPEHTGVKFRLIARRTATHAGRTVTLKVFYSPRVGTFARIDNAPRDCIVVVDRTPGTQQITGVVGETVDAGISFAYTRVANNLQGRLARGALMCGDAGNGNMFVLARSNFF